MSEKITCRKANSVNAAANDARTWANELVRRESRGSGDTENAMRRLEYRYGIPWRTFWSLRYRPPSDVMVGIYERLRAAYWSECDRQQRLLQHELAVTKLKTGPDNAVVASIEALVATED